MQSLARSTGTPGVCLVTGAAGFVGSHLSERLLQVGCQVRGVDRFTDYYPRALKEANLAALSGRPGFSMVEADLAEAELAPLLDGVEYVFHQAGQPGVRASWGDSFRVYTQDNVVATQRLLEALRRHPGVRRVVYASSSSIYGNAPQLPVSEATLPRPISPYGVTKLAAEHLCHLYAANFGVPAVSLRYFTVYGPRQRPDMAFNRFIRALLGGRPLEIHGDGEQTRDFTYVDDIVDANLAAMTADPDRVVGRPYNLGGGSRVSVNQLVALLEELTGRRAEVRHLPAQPGDARDTAADCGAAAADLGFQPRVALREGLRAQVDSLRVPV